MTAKEFAEEAKALNALYSSGLIEKEELNFLLLRLRNEMGLSNQDVVILCGTIVRHPHMGDK